MALACPLVLGACVLLSGCALEERPEDGAPDDPAAVTGDDPPAAVTPDDPAAGDQATAVTPADSAERAGRIRAMLEASAGSWNAGDLEGFLDDYSTDPGLTFTGSAGVMRGRDEVRERYLRSYWAEGVERDSLRFEALEVRPLGRDHTLVLGTYVLHRPSAGDSVTATGPFTLVLRREGGEWKIIHDHSS